MLSNIEYLIVPGVTFLSLQYDLFANNVLNNYFESGPGLEFVEGFLGGVTGSIICNLISKNFSISSASLMKWIKVGLWGGAGAAIAQIILNALGSNMALLVPIGGAVAAYYGYNGY